MRIAYDVQNKYIYYLNIEGEVYRMASPYGETPPTRVFRSANHGLASNVLGLAISADGATMYIVGTDRNGGMSKARVARGQADETGAFSWSTFVETEWYPASNTVFDHHFNGIAISPDGAYVFLNSGSRTDHGEEQDNNGQFPGAREIPLTSALFRIPTDTSGVVLPNDEAALIERGFLFADGLRNTYDLAFDVEGNLFGPENAADRSDTEELNWIREGQHYGFPWRIGTNDMPQQFTDYDPDSDLLLPPQGNAVMNGFYRNDPTFPQPPEGVTFVDGALNLGSDARLYQAEDGRILEGDEENPVRTFTPHRSPLGLAFDVEERLPGIYQGKAFVLSWTSPDNPLLNPFGDEGEDLLMLDIQVTGEEAQLTTERLITGFSNPIDAVFAEGRLYVLEFGGRKNIWEIEFLLPASVEDKRTDINRIDVSVYPNPVNGTAYVHLHAMRNRQVDIRLYNALGQEVNTLFAGRSVAAVSSVIPVDTHSLPAGLYFIRSQSGLSVQVLPLVVIQ